MASPKESFSSALSLFSSLYQDMAPTDLPEGLSPDNQDVWYLPGQVLTRPGVNRYLNQPINGNPSIVSVADFPIPNGDYFNVYMDSTGVIWRKDVLTLLGTEAELFLGQSGAQFKSALGFNKQWFAFYGGQVTLPGLLLGVGIGPWSGSDIPHVYQPIPGAFWRVTYEAPGFDSASAADTVAAGSVTAGVHNFVILFQMKNGAITAPCGQKSWTAAGSKQVTISNIPLGPPDCLARIVAFTPAGGSSWFYLAPVSGLLGVALGGATTIIPDNTSTSATFNFSDAQLLSGIEIDVDGNNLFNQVVLAPCLGCIEYQGRMVWWGELNNLKNLVNMSFDGGYVSGGGVGVNHVPLGWANTGVTGGTDALVTISDGGSAASGSSTFGLQMTGANGGLDCLIFQGAYQDGFGGPIVQPKTHYLVRFRANLFNVGNNSGSLNFEIYSAGGGGVLSSASIGIGALIQASVWNWYQLTMGGDLPDAIPSDAVFRVYLNGTTAQVGIDDILLIDSHQPVLNNQLRVSYFDNPYGYDVISGIIGLDTNASITACFIQRGYLYILTDKGLWVTQDNGVTEPNGWTVQKVADQCGCAGPNAVDTGEATAVWAGRYGVRFFSGDAPVKISQEIEAGEWAKINWLFPTAVWVANDSVQRTLYVGTPINGPYADALLHMSYRAVNAAYNIPDPLHVSYSGRMICTDLCRKWTRWTIPVACGAMVTQQLVQGGVGQNMVFGAGAFGNLYNLNYQTDAGGCFSKKTDDDFGVIASYYTTYFHWNHDMEQNIPPLGLYRKIYNYLTAFVTGAGLLTITPLVDSLTNPWQPQSSVWNTSTKQWDVGEAVAAVQVPLTTGLTHDLDFRLNVRGDRVAFKIAVSPLPNTTDAAFNLQHMVVAGRADKVLPVRGAVL